MKEYAVRENHLFLKAYKKGKKYIGRTVVVYTLPDLHAGRLKKEHPQKKKINRIGLTVSAKLGGAVKRNRVKRILREAYRQYEREVGIKCGFLIIIVARGAALSAKTQEIRADLVRAFDKLNMKRPG